MLNYFRINDLSRLIAIAVLLLIIRLPFYFLGDVITTEDVRYFMLGEKIASGSWMYIDIFTSEALLSGLFLGIIVGIFGKSIIAFHTIAFLLTVIQVYLFNELVTQNRATVNATYFPGLFYAIFISFFPAAFSLSPFIIGQTLLLVAMNYQFHHLELKAKRDEKIILIGILISIYSLFIWAAAVYILTAYLIFVLYTNTLLRRYLLIAVGFIIPYLMAWGIFEIAGYPGVFFSYFSNFYDSIWRVDDSFLWQSILPFFFLIIFLRRVLFGGRFTNYQATLNFAVLFYALSSIIVFWLGRIPADQAFILLVPLLALYASHFFITKRSLAKSILFFLLISGTVFTNVVDWTRPEFLANWIKKKGANDNPLERFSEKSLLVLDEGFELYHKGNRHASKFFDWQISRNSFEAPLDYGSIQSIYSGLNQDLPEIIFDPNDMLSRFIEQIPDLKRRYRKQDNLWILSNN